MKKNVEQYLQTEGTDGMLTEKYVGFATNAKEFDQMYQMYQKQDWDHDIFDFHKDFSEMFCLLELPLHWSFNRTVDVSIFIDVYMYILFLGCMKAIASIIKSCMKDKHKTQYFLCILNPNLKALNNFNSPNLPSNRNTCTDMSFGNYLSQDWVTMLY